MTEGKVIVFFQSLHIPGGRFCPICGNIMAKHGILVLPTEEETICPGDYIVTRRSDRSYYRMSAREFEALYEPTKIGS